MIRSIMVRIAFLFAVVCFVNAAVPQKVEAQIFASKAQPFYRFRVNNINLGYFLTADYQEGINSQFAPDGFFGGSPLSYGILEPPAGYTPSAGQNLFAFHKWRVLENGRLYYYYSWAYHTITNSNYTYQGSVGYVLPPGDSRGVDLLVYYSQKYGYWYTTNQYEQRPDVGTNSTTYAYQGVACSLPLTDSNPYCSANPTCYYFEPSPPPPPPPTCDPVEEQNCYNNGGSWDSSTCQCNYNPPCPPDMICP